MNNLKIFCLSLSNTHYKKILDLNYIPVGLGEDIFSENWITDQDKNNITHKNKYYGEYTFHYKIWKNDFLKNYSDQWIGFCTYRRFWSQLKKEKKVFNFDKDILNKLPKEWENYDCVLANPIYTTSTKFSKIFKHGKKILFKNPLLFFSKKNITIKVHFDMYHGHGNLDKAIDLLKVEDREKFRKYVNTEILFSPYNMFICKSKKTLFDYYSSLFPWLKNCESIFGFDLENDYGKKRIYGFLAERYLSYWFNNYANPIKWPVYFKDIS